MTESVACQQQPTMNYGGGGGATNSSENAASGWENILLTNYFGDGGGAPGPGAANAADGGAPPSDSNGDAAATATAGYDATGYNHYLQGGYAATKGSSHGGESNAAAGAPTTAMTSRPGSTTNAYYGAPYGDPHGAAAAPGLNYSGVAGYSLAMPSEQGGQYDPGYGPPPGGGGGTGHGHPRYASGEAARGGYNASPVGGGPASVGQGETLAIQRPSSDESQPNNNDPYAVDYGNAADYGNYYAPAPPPGGGAAGGGAPNNSYPPPANNYGGGAASSQHNNTQPQSAYNPTNMSEMDYCDALLRGMDDPSFGWLTGAAATAFGSAANSVGPRNIVNGYANHPTGGAGHPPSQRHGFATGLGGTPAASAGGSHPAAGGLGKRNDTSALDAFFLAQQQQQSASSAHASKKGRNARSAAAAATTSSTRLAPNGTGHSSLPSVQIDPLLEKVTLTVTAVSLQPLSGNQVVRHVRTKTDDVVTRFLPCVDFLVNCQQELRQGLQLAQRSRGRSHGRRGGGGGMTPRQFHAAYVAPLPKRFERHNEGLMAREHLRGAKQSLELLVRDAHACVAQGCDHVKNAFLGGMRENESWGLRKWLSRHGGAGSICNDLEEVSRHVKALPKDEETTKRLAEMLRPIARQAHDRLKKDVPQAYQEQSSAHPYLPFFHRLEACLKQMATYDPEEDDVICLDSSDDEDEEDVRVVMPRVASGPVAAAAGSSPAKRRAVKRKGCDDASVAVWGDAKRSRTNAEDEYAESIHCEGVGQKPAAMAKAEKVEPEVICLDDSDEEDENDNDAKERDDLGENSLSPLPPAGIDSPIEEYTTTLQQNPSVADGYSQASSPAGEGAGGGATGEKKQWRCSQCTFLNEAFAAKCVMCNDDDSSAGGGNASNDLANFLGGSEFLDSGASNHSFATTSAEGSRDEAAYRGPAASSRDQRRQRLDALQSADSRELECLAEHIASGGSLPKQAHRNTDAFWGTMETFPQILRLFRTILQHPSSHRYLEEVNESHLFMIGMPPYSSIVRHPKICFHGIVSALSKSEDAVKFPHLTMRLSNGQLPLADDGSCDGELQNWNMWNGLHLIEAVDLVLLNSLAYNANRGGAVQPQHIQQRTETEALRNILWEGVNSMLKERLQPHERRDHLPQRRRANSAFVMVNQEAGY